MAVYRLTPTGIASNASSTLLSELLMEALHEGATTHRPDAELAASPNG